MYRINNCLHINTQLTFVISSVSHLRACFLSKTLNNHMTSDLLQEDGGLWKWRRSPGCTFTRAETHFCTSSVPQFSHSGKLLYETFWCFRFTSIVERSLTYITPYSISVYDLLWLKVCVYCLILFVLVEFVVKIIAWFCNFPSGACSGTKCELNCKCK